jgi:predicted PurR-regulated permease PerM
MQPAPAPEPQAASTPEPLELAAERSGRAWRRLWLRIRSITPSAVARTLLVVGAAAVVWQLISGAGLELLPFEVGLALAYLTLPVVDWLSRWMPRQLAAIVLVVLELGLFVGILAVLVPPVVDELTKLIGALPTASELQARLADVQALLMRLPEPTRLAIQDGVDRAVLAIRGNLSLVLQAALAFVLAGAVGVLNTLGFVLAMIGIPTWLVAVLTDHRAGVRAINRVLPTWAQPDVWAVIRIVDRAFSTYIRGQLFLAVLVGALVFGGLWALEQLGVVAVRYRLVLALIATLTQLIPTVGPILGALPAIATGFSISREAGVAILILYVGIQQLLGAVVVPRVERRAVDIHPAVMVVALVLFAPLGLLWVLLAAPLMVASRDLFRYAYGRFGDPPRPAGLLPGQARPRLERVR